MLRTQVLYITFVIYVGTIGAARVDTKLNIDHDDDPMPTNVRVADAEKTAEFWKSHAAESITKKTQAPQNMNIAKNVIFFIGDGLSVPTLAAARTYMGQKEGANGEEYEMSFEKFPSIGLSKTYCVNYQVPDSACTATAYLAGVKNNYGTIGVTAAVSRHDCESQPNEANWVHSIAQWALDAGKDAGIVTTTRITHASPAGAYAHTANRSWESDTDAIDRDADPNVCRDIAHQLIHEEPGKHFKVILGGGKSKLIPNTMADEEGVPGQRSDDANLIDDWLEDKAEKNVNGTYIWSRDELLNLDYDKTDYLLGLFEGDHLQYHLERNEATEPTLPELTEAAIKILSKNSNGYFLFIEAGRIDHAHHENWARLAFEETAELSHAVDKALELTDDSETLIVVASDHSHVMAFNGYPWRGRDILGMSGSRGQDNIPYPIISYTNGPGFRPHVDGQRVDITSEDLSDVRFRSPVDVHLNSETHGGDDVAVFALGPFHHLFTGLYEQSDLPHIMGYAACIGPGITRCNSATALTMGLLPLAYALFSLFVSKFWN